jgi:hypothetical protein
VAACRPSILHGNVAPIGVAGFLQAGVEQGEERSTSLGQASCQVSNHCTGGACACTARGTERATAGRNVMNSRRLIRSPRRANLPRSSGKPTPCPCRKLYPAILMVKPTEDGLSSELAEPLDRPTVR